MTINGIIDEIKSTGMSRERFDNVSSELPESEQQKLLHRLVTDEPNVVVNDPDSKLTPIFLFITSKTHHGPFSLKDIKWTRIYHYLGCG